MRIHVTEMAALSVFAIAANFMLLFQFFRAMIICRRRISEQVFLLEVLRILRTSRCRTSQHIRFRYGLIVEDTKLHIFAKFKYI